MSKIALTGNASGTGTLTIAAPNTNSDRTINLADEAGTLLINGTTSNVGINGTPAVYSAGYALQINRTSINDDDGGFVHFTQNAHYDNAWKYIENGWAERMMFNSGSITLSVASATNSSGADAALTWVDRLTVQQDGDIKLIDAAESSTNHQAGSILTKDLTGSTNGFQEGPRLEGSATDGKGR